MTKVLLVTQDKGGVGKTVISRALAEVIPAAPLIEVDSSQRMLELGKRVKFFQTRADRETIERAREYELALPASVSAQQREAITRAFAQELVLRYGVAVTTAIHEPSRYGDDRNFHAHILSTTRRMEVDGLGKKTRILDDIKTGPQEVLYLRGYACELINDALERAGVDERVDHRSLEARGVDREATEHLGSTASEMERNGQASEKGDRNREIEEDNRKRDKLVEELAAIDAEIAAEEERLLDERYGDADYPDLESPVQDPDSTDTEGAPPEERKRSYDESMTEYAEQLAEEMRARARHLIRGRPPSFRMHTIPRRDRRLVRARGGRRRKNTRPVTPGTCGSVGKSRGVTA
jgi:MobA/MobL family